MARGAGALLSFGIAGGLAPGLAAGDLLLPGMVLTPARQRISCDRDWRRALIAAGPPTLRDGTLVGSDCVITTTTAKAGLHGQSGGLAVDMESHSVAAVALGAGVPFLVLRAVADPANRALPGIAAGSVDGEGRPRSLTVLARLARRPGQLSALIALRADVKAAHAALWRLKAIAAPLFGGPGRAGLGTPGGV